MHVVDTSLKQSTVKMDGMERSTIHWVYRNWPWKQYNRAMVL